MADPTPIGPMDEDLQHLEENLHRLAHIARSLARDVDAVEAQLWNEPYAYRAATAAIKASANLRRQLETRWLVTPLSNERAEQLPAVDPLKTRKRTPKDPSYPHVIQRGS